MSDYPADPAIEAADQLASEAADAAHHAEFVADKRMLPAHDFNAIANYPAQVTGAGVKSATAFSLKSFLPDPDFIRREVLILPVGQELLIGQITGTVYEAERRMNEWQGKQLPSVALKGHFLARAKDGRQVSFPLLFLPRSFSEQVALAFEHEGAQRVEIDVDAGLKTTGKTIPYEWTITYYLEGRATQALKARMNRRELGKPPVGWADQKAIGTAAD